MVLCIVTEYSTTFDITYFQCTMACILYLTVYSIHFLSRKYNSGVLEYYYFMVLYTSTVDQYCTFICS